MRSWAAVRIEWVYDNNTLWIIQLQQELSRGVGHTIVPGEPEGYQYFDVSSGMARLRQLIAEVRGTNEGIIVIGRIGLTSHIADVLRRSGIPSKLTAVVSE